MENEYTSHKFILFAIFVPDILTVGGNLTKFWRKLIFHSFLRHGVYSVTTTIVIVIVAII